MMEKKSLVHDLLNSLTIVDGNLSLGLSEYDLDRVKTRIEKATLANKRAIDICKAELEEQEKTLTEVKDFYHLSTQILQDLYSKIEITFENNSSGRCLVNKSHFFRVNENIIKNSVEAGATKLVITYERDKISFTDNGLGMTSDNVRSIAKNGTSKDSGHGIGLGSVASFCAEHGFRLKFGNNDKGDLFHCGFHIHLLLNP